MQKRVNPRNKKIIKKRYELRHASNAKLCISNWMIHWKPATELRADAFFHNTLYNLLICVPDHVRSISHFRVIFFFFFSFLLFQLIVVECNLCRICDVQVPKIDISIANLRCIAISGDLYLTRRTRLLLPAVFDRFPFSLFRFPIRCARHTDLCARVYVCNRIELMLFIYVYAY